MKRIWSNYQQDIFGRIVDTKENIIIQASAGSGKSSTLFEAIRRLHAKEKFLSTMFFSFNKEIQLHAEKNLKDVKDCKVYTFHGYGNHLIRSTGFAAKWNAEMDVSKVFKHVFDTSTPFVPDKSKKKYLFRLVSQLRTLGFLSYDTELIKQFLREGWADVFGFPNEGLQKLIEANINKVANVLKDLDEDKVLYDFDDMCRFPLIYGMLEKKALPDNRIPNVIFVDECFPYWTPVLIDYDKWVPIGEIVENPERYTHVLSYDLEQKKILRKRITSVKKAKSKVLLEIEVQNFDGEKGYIRCTPNHKLHVVGRGTILARDLKEGDRVITYNGDLPERAIYHEGKLLSRFEHNKVTKKHKKCPHCGEYFERVSMHIHREHTSDGARIKKRAKLAAKKFWESESSDWFKKEQSDRMKSSNPMKKAETREKMGRSVSKRFWSKAKSERDKQVTRFVQAPKYRKGAWANKVEQSIINLEIGGLFFTGDGYLQVPLNLDGRTRHKIPDFVHVPSNCDLSPNFSPEKVVEVMDFEYWHSRDEIKPLKRAYKEVGIDCLILNAKLPLIEKRERIESFINNHHGTVTAIKELHSTHGEHDVYDINVDGTHLFWVSTVSQEASKRLTCNKEYKYKPRFPMLVHNCQDLNEYQFLFIEKLMARGARVISCGDKCQPANTQISVVRKNANAWHKEEIETVNISDLKIGDQIISYNVKASRFVKNRKVLGITKRPYEGSLVTVETKYGNKSSYTPEHHCLINLRSLRYRYAVYIMQRDSDGSFRVGVSKTYSKAHVNGLRHRLIAEKADKLWVLTTFKNRNAALREEQIVSMKFGIPQIMFTPKNNSQFTESDLNYIWSQIDTSILQKRVVRCLESYGRDLRFPLFERSGKYYSATMPIEVRACNILDGALVAVYNGDINPGAKKIWKIVRVTRTQYTGYVYSLSVEGEHLYCADGIITHNCQAIYGFRGADMYSMSRLQTLTKSVEMPLSITYRCKSNIVRFVKSRMPSDHGVEIDPHLEGGKVIRKDTSGQKDYYDLDRLLSSGTQMVVSPKNKHLMSIWISLFERKIPSSLKGSKITNAIVNLLKTMQGESVPFSEVASRCYALAQQEHLDDKSKDLANTCYEFLTRLKFANYDQAYNQLKQIGENDKGIKLHTIHSSKGLESEKIWYINDMFESPQMANMTYVGLTRASDRLYVVVNEEWGIKKRED